VPIAPAAPPRLSTTNGLPNIFVSLSAVIRPNTSAMPPGPYGTTTLTGRVGHSCLWVVAQAAHAVKSKYHVSIAGRSKCKRGRRIAGSLPIIRSLTVERKPRAGLK
jgi:hypothetical protein